MSAETFLALARQAEFRQVVARARVAKDAAKEDLSPPQVAPAPPTEAAPAEVRRVFRGLPVVIDRPKGHVMRGVGADGKEWRRVYHVDYGYVPGTKGGDGEGLDVFLGGDEDAREAFWISQLKPDGTFDEYKVMVGFADLETAKLMYYAHVPKRFFGSACSMSLEMMKALLGIDPIESIAKGAALAVEVAKMLRDLGPVDAAPSPPVEDAVERRVELVASAKAEGGVVDGVELRYVLGVALEPEVVDSQGDVYSADEIRKSAWDYLIHFRNVGFQHKGFLNGKVHVVESYLAPADVTVGGRTVKAGTWLLGLRIDDDRIWEQVKSGELTGLSIGGWARREPVG